MIIMFVRHGESINDKLTDFGIAQCEMMADSEEEYKFSKIYSSVANRCKETAKFLCEKFGLDLVLLEGVKDRDQLENEEPQNADEKEWYENYLNKNYSHKKPEGCKEFLKRNFAEFDKIILAHKEKNENVILVAHSCTFYAIQEYFNASVGDEIKYYRLGNCSKVYFEVK